MSLTSGFWGRLSPNRSICPGTRRDWLRVRSLSATVTGGDGKSSSSSSRTHSGVTEQTLFFLQFYPLNKAVLELCQGKLGIQDKDVIVTHKLYLKVLVYEYVFYGFMYVFLFQSAVQQIISRLEGHLGPHLDQGPRDSCSHAPPHHRGTLKNSRLTFVLLRRFCGKSLIFIFKKTFFLIVAFVVLIFF